MSVWLMTERFHHSHRQLCTQCCCQRPEAQGQGVEVQGQGLEVRGQGLVVQGQGLGKLILKNKDFSQWQQHYMYNRQLRTWLDTLLLSVCTIHNTITLQTGYTVGSNYVMWQTELTPLVQTESRDMWPRPPLTLRPPMSSETDWLLSMSDCC